MKDFRTATLARMNHQPQPHQSGASKAPGVIFKKIEINEERNLEHLVVQNPESVEKGLVYLSHQHRAGGKFIDVLAVDANGIFVILELKVGQDDEMLLQALEYYDYVSSNRDRLAKEYEKRAKIVAAEDPRIILVASAFTDRLRKAVQYFKPRTALMEYAYLEGKPGERGLFCREVQFDVEGGFTPPVSLDNALSYINQPKARQAAEKVHAELCKIGRNIEASPRDGYVRYMCKNRVVGDVSLRRTFFHVSWKLDQDNWDGVKIASLHDWSKHKQQVLKGFAKQYRAVGGE